MSPFAPEYGTSDYARWRAQVTPDSLRWYIDASVMQTLRATLSAGAGSAEFSRSSNEQLLHVLARLISGGELAIFGQPSRSSHPSQWLCSDSHVPFHTLNSHTARSAPAARGVWTKPDLVEDVVVTVARTAEVQRYRLFVALAYEHTKHVCANTKPKAAEPSPEIGGLVTVTFETLKDLLDQMASDPEIDALVLTGDLIDYNRNFDPASVPDWQEHFAKPGIIPSSGAKAWQARRLCAKF